MRQKMDRIYHNHEKWEDAKAGMYDNPANLNQEVDTIVAFFNNPYNLKKYMVLVCEEWVYACEHNLSNPAMNKIAYIGQACIAYRFGFSRESTMKAWNYLSQDVQKKANEIAKETLNNWETKYHG